MLNVGWFTSAAGIWRRDDDLDRQVRFPVPAYVIETAEERILVDTGLHPAAVEDAGAPLRQARRARPVRARARRQRRRAGRPGHDHQGRDDAPALRSRRRAGAAAVLGPDRRAAPRVGGGPRRGRDRQELLPAARLRHRRRAGRARRRRPRPARRRLDPAAARRRATRPATSRSGSASGSSSAPTSPTTRPASTTAGSRSSPTTSPRRPPRPTACARSATAAPPSARDTTRPSSSPAPCHCDRAPPLRGCRAVCLRLFSTGAFMPIAHSEAQPKADRRAESSARRCKRQPRP